MPEGYITIFIKNRESAMRSMGQEVSLVVYSSLHIEKACKVFSFGVGDNSRILDSLANHLAGKTVVTFGQLAALQELFRVYERSVPVIHLDCKELLSLVFPFLKRYGYHNIVELFRLDEISGNGDYTDCRIIRQLYLAALMGINGKLLHEITPSAERFLSGYWEEHVEPGPYAKLSILKGGGSVLAGRFRLLDSKDIGRVVENSDGRLQSCPDDATANALVGNSEFPAEYRSSFFKEVLLRIRRNQNIRIISEVELLSLLHGQVTWSRRVNPLYNPAKADVVLSSVILGNNASGAGRHSLKVSGKPVKDVGHNRGGLSIKS